MLSSLAQRVILAKIRAMFGRRISPKDYSAVMNALTVPDIAAYLKGDTQFRDTLAHINPVTIHRGQLENLLRRDYFSRYVRLLKYDKDNDFYRYVMTDNEIAQIIMMIRLINSGSADQYILSLPTFLAEHSEIDLMKFTTVKSFGDLLEILKASPYYKVLKDCVPDASGEMNLIDCERKLRTYYFETIFGLIGSHYFGKARQSLTEYFKMEVDMVNLSILYRIKQSFAYDPSFFDASLLKIEGYIPPKKLEQMAESPDLAALQKIILTTRYDKIFASNPNGTVEDVAERIRLAFVKKNIHTSIITPVVMVSYVAFCNIELANLIKIIEGVRYQIGPQEISKLIITD